MYVSDLSETAVATKASPTCAAAFRTISRIQFDKKLGVSSSLVALNSLDPLSNL